MTVKGVAFGRVMQRLRIYHTRAPWGVGVPGVLGWLTGLSPCVRVTSRLGVPSAC